MDLPLIYNLIFIFLLLFGSAFFCFAEGSLFSLGRHQRQSLYKENTRTSNVIKGLLSNPFKLIITILFADEVVNVAFSSVVGLTVQKLMTGSSEKMVAIISIAIASPTLLLLGEIGPKTIAVKFPRIIAKAISYPLHLFHLLITPIRWVLMILSIGFTKLFGGNVGFEEHNGFTTDELRILVGIGNEEGVLNEVERNLVNKFFNLEDIPVYKIMTPNIDCFMLSSEYTVKDAVYEIKKRGYSRIPVYKGELNNIIGILYSKDILTSNT
ncbi:MAG: CNNM domain-containing protein, partial [Thermodesulfobacteriota bacterium]